jgi:hypothetical protein
VKYLPISRKHQYRIAEPNTIRIMAKVVVGVSLMQSGCLPFGNRRAVTLFDQVDSDFGVPATMMHSSMIANIQYPALRDVSDLSVFEVRESYPPSSPSLAS